MRSCETKGLVLMFLGTLKNTASAAFFGLVLSHPTWAGSIDQPKLYDDSDYTEYWEQQFLFGNGTMVTSQFLIANFPFSKQHGLMIATLKKPGGDTVIIKNGRQRDGWVYSENGPKLSIYQHSIEDTEAGFDLKLHNTTGEVAVSFSDDNSKIELIPEDNPLDLPGVSLYAPNSDAQGRWRAGPEIGGEGENGAWEELGTGGGYGIHVVQKQAMNAALRRWKRFTAMESTGQFEPVLHEFETQKGKEQKILLLIPEAGEPIRFDNVTLTENGSDSKWKLSAQNASATLSGTFETNGTIDEFILEDHLNHLEQLAAGSLSDIKRYRHTAHYSMTLTMDGVETALSGSALAEDIHLGEVKKRKRRARR